MSNVTIVTQRQAQIARSVYFRPKDSEESFEVVLHVDTKDGITTAIDDETFKFFNYLRDLNLVDKEINPFDWFDSFEHGKKTIVYPYKITTSKKIRKKADYLGLTIVLGNWFKKKKTEDLQKAAARAQEISNARKRAWTEIQSGLLTSKGLGENSPNPFFEGLRDVPFFPSRRDLGTVL